jgi:hypothetical protein
MSSALMSFSILLTNFVPADSVRSALEGREELWFICLLVASGGVAIGCVLEIPETWTDLKEWRKLRKESVEPPAWRVPMAAIGLLLVVLGVIGEGVFEALVSINETALRAHDEQALAETIKEAGTAKESAEKAQRASELASKSAGEALGKAETASATADKADQSARGALTTAGDARAEVATVQSNIAAVDEKYAPRTLSKIKRDILIELLSKARPVSPQPVVVVVSADAPDGSAYAAEIADAISDPATGWKAKAEGLMTSDGRNKGVFILVKDSQSAPLWTIQLQRALKSAGIGGEGANNPNIHAGTAEILIERK